jgi:hypothetical protein
MSVFTPWNVDMERGTWYSTGIMMLCYSTYCMNPVQAMMVCVCQCRDDAKNPCFKVGVCLSSVCAEHPSSRVNSRAKTFLHVWNHLLDTISILCVLTIHDTEHILLVAIVVPCRSFPFSS